MSKNNKPQASQHMLWFFVLPAIAFILFVGYKFSTSKSQEPQKSTLEQKLVKIESAKTPGDRWQAAYSLAQDLQQKIRTKEMSGLSKEQKDKIFSRLDNLLQEHGTDTRLKKYLLLTLGQIGDPQALSSLKRGIGDQNPEIQFFSAWGYLDILQKNKGVIKEEDLELIASWLDLEDPGFKKIASSFLVQTKNQKYINKVAKLMEDPETEVSWNAAVALATIGDKRAKETLLESFDIKKIRKLNMRSKKDLEQLVSTSYSAAQKIWDEDFKKAVDYLKMRTDPKTPEGGAIHKALR